MKANELTRVAADVEKATAAANKAAAAMSREERIGEYILSWRVQPNGGVRATMAHAPEARGPRPRPVPQTPVMTFSQNGECDPAAVKRFKEVIQGLAAWSAGGTWPDAQAPAVDGGGT